MKLLQFVLSVLLGLIGLFTLSASTVTGLLFLIIASALLINAFKIKSKTSSSVTISITSANGPVVFHRKKAKRQLKMVGNVDPICPHCNKGLEKKPGRKKKCPHCGQFIYVRTRPSDGKRVLVTETQAEEIAEQWAIVNGTHDAYLAERRRFAQEKAKLARRFGREPSDNDVRWSLLNQELIEHAMKGNWGLFRNAKVEMAEILRREGKHVDALGFYLEVCYLDLNGPNNTNGITDQKLLREYPPWNPRVAFADLAPGILYRASSIITKTEMDIASVKALYDRRASLLHNSLRLPLAPDAAWPRIYKALFEDE